MKIKPAEAIKEQIEQKAREYALIPIDINIDTYGSEEQIGSYNDFLAGAEAMREMANTWHDIETTPPANKQVVCKIEYIHLPEVKVFCQYEIDKGEHKMLGITHWKPITL